MNNADKTANPSALEVAIRDKAEKAISEIARRESEEMKKLDDTCAGELEEFRRQSAARTDAGIARESTRVKNRAGLELRKLKLKHVEEFITRTVEEVVKGIRDNPGYKNFLAGAVRDAVGRIPAGAEIRIKKEDIVFENDIRRAVERAGGKHAVISEDGTIKWGGCIIVDVHGGRVFDGTIERVYYRKAPVIRFEIMKLLGNPPGRQ